MAISNNNGNTSGNKFRGNVYNQSKQQPADELAEVLKQPAQTAEQVTTEVQDQAAQESAETQTQTPQEFAEEQAANLLAPETQSAPAPGETEEKEEPIQLPAVSEKPVPVNPPDQKVQTRIMKNIERDLLSYMEAVHPKQIITDEVGGAWQSSLFQTLKRILGNPDPEEFKVEWNTLLAFFHKHSAEMFNENFMFRFQHTWKGSAKDYVAFRNLVYTVIRTADPQTRQKESRDIVLDRITQGLDAQAATNLVNYYS